MGTHEKNKGWFLLVSGVILFSSPLLALHGRVKKPTLRISGSFVQPWLAASWSADQWKNQVEGLRKSGAKEHIIWQWTVDSYNKVTYYPSRLPYYKMASTVEKDPLAVSLALAKKNRMKIWLGVNWNVDWWKKFANDMPWLANEFAIGRQVADELWENYKRDYASTIEGFYLTMEVDNFHFSNKEDQNRMAKVYKDFSDHIHRKMHKKVMIAPFCTDKSTMKPKDWQKMWENILRQTSIDVVNLQDGCGASDDGKTTHTTIKTVGSWFSATRKAIKRTCSRAKLWSTLETFDMDGQKHITPLRRPHRIRQQVKAVSPYVSKITSFALIHYPIPRRKK